MAHSKVLQSIIDICHEDINDITKADHQVVFAQTW